MAKAHLEGCRQQLEKVEKAIEEHIGFVGERDLRHSHQERIEAVAVQGAIEGYNAGVKANLGRLRGVKKGGGK